MRARADAGAVSRALPPPVSPLTLHASAGCCPRPLAPLPPGFKLERELAALGVATAAQLRAQSSAELARQFGERVGAQLYWMARGKVCMLLLLLPWGGQGASSPMHPPLGRHSQTSNLDLKPPPSRAQDPTPVQPRGPPKAVTVEDSFRSAASWEAVQRVVGVLAPDLLARIQEEAEVKGTHCGLWGHGLWVRSASGVACVVSSACDLGSGLPLLAAVARSLGVGLQAWWSSGGSAAARRREARLCECLDHGTPR